MGRALLLFVASATASFAGDPTYAGAAACSKCHAEVSHKWSQSRHSKMVQPASGAGVKGDFSRGRVALRGDNYTLTERGGAYYITESYLSGKPQEHKIDYTLGNRRMQHYLTTLPDGRIVVLPPTWDVQRKQWFHNMDIADPDETSEILVQIWNKGCYSCHVSQEEKNYDNGTDSYKTVWLDFGTNCERCHGPGSLHIANHSNPKTKTASSAHDIVLQTRLDPARNTMVCAQCHSLRDIYATGYTAGANYYDYYLPVIEFNQPIDRDPSYWPDGRTRRFSNDAFGLWQSECFLKGGVTCVGCHTTPHEVDIEKNPQLRPDANALCTRCHSGIEKALTTHTHHAPASTGSSCVECHMPRTVLSIKAEIRDHSMSIPVPENTIRHNIPNACNNCHKDRNADWALDQMNKWYRPGSRQKLMHRADAFTRARAGDRDSIPQLLEILGTLSEGPLVRANALGYLTSFSDDPRVFPAVARSLSDPEAIVRVYAALRMSPGPANKDAAVAALKHALNDSAATVRIGATVSLVSMGIASLTGEEGVQFEAAKKLFRARANLNSDNADQLLGAGKFYLLTGDPIEAIGALQASLKIDPEIPAKYYLAYAKAQQGHLEEARQILAEIPSNDPQYAKAQNLLKALGGQ